MYPFTVSIWQGWDEKGCSYLYKAGHWEFDHTPVNLWATYASCTPTENRDRMYTLKRFQMAISVSLSYLKPYVLHSLKNSLHFVFFWDFV